MENGIYWVCDYDIKQEPAALKMQFYRRLWKILETHQIPPTQRSTASVFISGSQIVATEIHELASRYGTSNLYQATKIEGTQTWANTKPLFIEA